MNGAYYRPETYRAKTAISYLVRRAHNFLLPQLEALFSEHGLTFTHWVVLMYLRDGMADTVSDIARDMHHDSGALTRIVDQLEARELVTRRRSSTDRRVVQLSLTPAGKKTVECLLPMVANFLNDAMSDFTRQEADQLIGLLTRLVSHLEWMKGEQS